MKEIDVTLHYNTIQGCKHYHLSDIQGRIASPSQRPASGLSLSFSAEGGREGEGERERERERLKVIDND